jgi:hypothetical protein
LFCSVTEFKFRILPPVVTALPFEPKIKPWTWPMSAKAADDNRKANVRHIRKFLFIV